MGAPCLLCVQQQKEDAAAALLMLLVSLGLLRHPPLQRQVQQQQQLLLQQQQQQQPVVLLSLPALGSLCLWLQQGEKELLQRLHKNAHKELLLLQLQQQVQQQPLKSCGLGLRFLLLFLIGVRRVAAVPLQPSNQILLRAF